MHPMMMAEIAADQIRDMHADAARDQRARPARRGRRAGPPRLGDTARRQPDGDP